MYVRVPFHWLRCSRVISLSVLLGSLFLHQSRAEDLQNSVLQNLIKQTSEAVEGAKLKKVSVLDFTDTAGGTSMLGKYLAEEISVGLVQQRKDFDVFDRANLRNILKEHALSEHGLVKSENAQELGKWSGVDGLVTGTVTAMGSGYVVTVKVISTSLTKIGGVARAKLPADPDWEKMFHEDGGPGPENMAPLSPREFRSESFLAKWSKMQVLRNGDILVTLLLSKLNPQQRVNLHVALASLPLNVRDPKILSEILMKSSSRLRASTGEEYNLLETSGYPLYNYLVGREGPGLGDRQPSVITLRFHLAPGARGVLPATTTFTLDFNVTVHVSEDATAPYRDKGQVNIHFTDLR